MMAALLQNAVVHSSEVNSPVLNNLTNSVASFSVISNSRAVSFERTVERAEEGWRFWAALISEADIRHSLGIAASRACCQRP